ncbi:phage minor capsid protein [Micromonospora rifamycinica]|uniref:phage minor capsid protein n=1 Tax=Micromonospora rifamycinica TaxID=291594 RepID=UPI00342A95C1
MTVSPDQIGAISRATVDMYRVAESALVALVARYLRAGIDGPMWATQRLAAVSALRRAAQAVVARLDRDAPGAIGQAAAAAYRAGHGSALTDLPEDAATRLASREAVRTVRQPAVVESLASALVADVGEQHSNVVRDTLDVYRKVIAEATAVSVAGGQTRQQAAQHAYARLIDQGITGFTDRAGRRWRLSSYVEMGVRTVTQRAAAQGQTDRLQSAGIRLVIVSDAVQECALCRPFEGKVLAISAPAGQVQARNPVTGATVAVQAMTTLDRARAAGFQHPNCRHSVSAYLPGVTRHPTRPTADPQGDEARQRQRAIERAIRRWKERQTGALDADAAKAAGRKVRAWQAEMRDHLAANPALKRLAYREQIGAGNIPPAAPTPLAPPAPRPRPTTPPADPTVRPISPDDAQQMQDQMLAGQPWTPDQRMSLLEYTAGWAREMNGLLRGAAKAAKGSFEQAFVRDAMAAMRPLARAVLTHRYVHWDAFGVSGEGGLAGLAGRTLQDRGFMSTTISRLSDNGQMQIAQRRRIRMDIEVPAGTPAAYVEALSAHPGQHELILAPGTSYRVMSVREDGPHIVVTVRVVGHA